MNILIGLFDMNILIEDAHKEFVKCIENFLLCISQYSSFLFANN